MHDRDFVAACNSILRRYETEVPVEIGELESLLVFGCVPVFEFHDSAFKRVRAVRPTGYCGKVAYKQALVISVLQDWCEWWTSRELTAGVGVEKFSEIVKLSSNMPLGMKATVLGGLVACWIWGTASLDDLRSKQNVPFSREAPRTSDEKFRYFIFIVECMTGRESECLSGDEAIGHYPEVVEFIRARLAKDPVGLTPETPEMNGQADTKTKNNEVEIADAKSEFANRSKLFPAGVELCHDIKQFAIELEKNEPLSRGAKTQIARKITGNNRDATKLLSRMRKCHNSDPPKVRKFANQ